MCVGMADLTCEQGRREEQHNLFKQTKRVALRKAIHDYAEHNKMRDGERCAQTVRRRKLAIRVRVCEKYRRETVKTISEHSDIDQRQPYPNTTEQSAKKQQRDDAKGGECEFQHDATPLSSSLLEYIAPLRALQRHVRHVASPH